MESWDSLAQLDIISAIDKKLNGKYSFFTIAGSSIGVTANKFKRWHKVFWDNFETSFKLHNIKRLIVINHRDCGAAKIINGKKEFNTLKSNGDLRRGH